MKYEHPILFISLLLISITVSEGSVAQWPETGIPVCINPSSQESPIVVADEYGSVVLWTDKRDGTRIFAQRVDMNGNCVWANDGIPVLSQATSFDACSDGSGGVFLAWSYGTDVYAQRITRDGVPTCPPGGCVVADFSNSQTGAVIAPDGEGGAYIAWNSLRWDPSHPHDEDYDIYVQRIDSMCGNSWGYVRVFTMPFYAGLPQISTSSDGGALVSCHIDWGLQVAKINRTGTILWSIHASNMTSYDHSLASDGFGGAIVAWYSDSIRVSRIDSLGVTRWGEYGMPVLTGSSFSLVGDRAGGAYIANGYTRVQKVDSSGTLPWGGSGILMTTPYPVVVPRSCPLNGGDAGFAFRSAINDLYVQGLTRDGIFLFPFASHEIYGVQDSEWGYDLDSGGGTSMMVVWEDVRNANSDIYIQRVTPYGGRPELAFIGDREVDVGATLTIQLEAEDPDTSDTLTFSTDAGTVLPSPFTFDSSSGLFEWAPDPADAGYYDVTFEVTDGYFIDRELITISVTVAGNHSPVIHAPDRITVYKEGTVIIPLTAEDQDVGDVLTFSIDDPRYTQDGGTFTWQTVSSDAGVYHPTVSVSDGALSDSSSVTVTVFDISAILHDPLITNSGAWSENGIEWLATDDGYIRSENVSWYSAILSESTFETTHRFFAVFRVENNGSQNYIMGFTETGPAETDYYYDKITLGVYVHSSGSIRPSWDVNDTGYWNTNLGYGIFDIQIAIDGASGYFAAAAEEVAGFDSPPSTFDDPLWSNGESRYIPSNLRVQINPYNYNARVYDIWIFDGDAIVDAESDLPPPANAMLHQNFPNPFNPSTSIRYYIPERTHVSMDIYDVGGRRITRLVDMVQDEGTHTVTWDGTNDEGARASSGIYFCVLRTDGDTRSRKIVLLR